SSVISWQVLSVSWCIEGMFGRGGTAARGSPTRGRSVRSCPQAAHELAYAAGDPGSGEEDHEDEDESEDRRPAIDVAGQHVLHEHDDRRADERAEQCSYPTEDDHHDQVHR